MAIPTSSPTPVALPSRPGCVVHRPSRSRTAEDAAPAPADGGGGLLFAFVAATLGMVGAIGALALLEGWWWLVPVVLVHWVATYVVVARINALLDDA